MPKASIDISKIYLDFIKTGQKKVLGTIYYESFALLTTRDTIRIVNKDNPDDFIICDITSLKRYANFREMLQKEGVQNMLPATSSLDEAIKIYRSFFDYPSAQELLNTEESLHGVLAIHIRVSEQE